MTAFSGNACLTRQGESTEQIKGLQQAIQDNTHKLAAVQRKRLLAEEEILKCTRETERRVDLMMEKSDVVDVLQQLGHLLQEERHLSEQLNNQASASRNQSNNLQERNECIKNKLRSLTAEILEVKQCLAEAKHRNMAAPTSKSKRKQSKSK